MEKPRKKVKQCRGTLPPSLIRPIYRYQSIALNVRILSIFSEYIILNRFDTCHPKVCFLNRFDTYHPKVMLPQLPGVCMYFVCDVYV
jgi:hypothetical protein